MRLEDQPESQNVEDRRGHAGPARGAGGGGGLGGLPLPLGRGGMGIGGIVLLLVVAYFSGINPLQLLSGNATPAAAGGAPQPGGGTAVVDETPQEAKRAKEVRQMLSLTEECWNALFREHLGRAYQAPTLVLFRDQVSSACGQAGASVGPFYCPGDNKVYLDLSFFDVMDRQLGAKGDFAQAYVIAHEVGHHVQNLLGTNRKVEATRRMGEKEYNRASVRLELQADYYAGCWAYYVRTRRPDIQVDLADYQEAIGAAHAVGDDTLQKKSTGTVVPEKFTHGSAEQRKKWFKLGFESGDPTKHDPFVEER